MEIVGYLALSVNFDSGIIHRQCFMLEDNLEKTGAVDETTLKTPQ
jgi:hypothetical protein